MREDGGVKSDRASELNNVPSDAVWRDDSEEGGGIGVRLGPFDRHTESVPRGEPF